MSYTLFRKQIGQQGVLPGELLMSSTDDLGTITTPGYINANENILPSDVITLCYGEGLNSKQTLNPHFNNGIITLEVIGGGGAINGAENLPGDEGLFSGVSGDLLQFKSLTAGANITLTPSGDNVTIAATGSGGGTITGIADVGTGEGHLSAGTSGANVQVKSLHAGTNVVITETGTTVTIAANNSAPSGIQGLLNLPGDQGIYAATVGGIAELKSLTAGSNITLSATGNAITINSTGGGGGGFAYQNAQWVAKNGNDANSGTSIDSPKLTVQAAITALGGSGVIHIEDNGTYVGAWSIGSGFDVTIQAPGATLNTTGVTLSGGGSIFKVNAYSFGTNFNNIISSANCTIYIDAQKLRGNFGNGTTNPNQIFIKAQEITGDFTFATNLTAIIEFDSLSGSVVDTSPGVGVAPAIYLYGTSQTGNITSTNTKIGGFLGVSSGSPIITGIKQGYFNGVYYGDQRNTGTWFNVGPVNGQPYNVVTWNTAQTNILNGSNFELYSNAYINYTGNNGYGRFDLTNDAAVPVGFKCWMFQNVNDNQTGVLSSGIGGVANIVSPSTVPGVAYTRRNGSWILLTKVAQSGGVATFNVSGDLWQSNLLSNSVNVYFSNVFGNNATATGTFEQPFKDPTSALAFVIATYTATPAYGINLVALDDATYGDQLDFTGTTNINIVSPTASFSRVSSGPGDNTITTDNPQQLIVLGTLITTGGGYSVNNTGTGVIICNIDIVEGGADNTSTGQILFQSYSIGGDFPNSGGGRVRYTTIYRNAGTDGPDAIGISTQGVSDDWAVKNQLTASGLIYPTVDGANGTVVTTNGAGVLSLQPISAPFYFSSNPVAFSANAITLDATFLGYRIIENNAAGACTWTMDTGVNLTSGLPAAVTGSSFNVFVSNGTGSTITLVSSAGSTVHGAPCSQTNFTISLKYTASNTWDIFY